MQKIIVVKKITSTLVGFAAGGVISAIVHNNTNPQSATEKASTAVGSLVLGSMVGDLAARYTDLKIDELIGFAEEARASK